jgi:D-alanyl-D-alanine carboxypeptidase
MFRRLSNYQRFSFVHKTSNARWTSDLVSKRSTEKLENKFEVQDPNLIFADILKNLTQKVGGKEHLIFPKV